MAIRIALTVGDYGAAMHMGSPVDYKTFVYEVECRELQDKLSDLNKRFSNQATWQLSLVECPENADG